MRGADPGLLIVKDYELHIMHIATPKKEFVFWLVPPPRFLLHFLKIPNNVSQELLFIPLLIGT